MNLPPKESTHKAYYVNYYPSYDLHSDELAKACSYINFFH